VVNDFSYFPFAVYVIDTGSTEPRARPDRVAELGVTYLPSALAQALAMPSVLLKFPKTPCLFPRPNKTPLVGESKNSRVSGARSNHQAAGPMGPGDLIPLETIRGSGLPGPPRAGGRGSVAGTREEPCTLTQGVCVYSCRTYYKAVRVGGGG
jgi:hypothetical protein